MHNKSNKYQCKMRWNKALNFGVGSIKLHFRAIVFMQYMHAKMFSIQMLLYIIYISVKLCRGFVLSCFSFTVVFLSSLLKSLPSLGTESLRPNTSVKLTEMEITLISLGLILFIISFVETCIIMNMTVISNKGGNHVQYLLRNFYTRFSM